MAFKFEKLHIWQKALELSDIVFQLSKKFPKEEMYVLTSQIRRSADSVALNIAEGSTGQSNKVFNRFLGIALRSNIEVVGCIYIAQRRGYIDPESFNKIYRSCEELLVMINSLRRSLVIPKK
jgi:four helix bundle protein